MLNGEVIRLDGAIRLAYDPAGKPWPVGHVLKNPELAAVLRAIAANGSQAPCLKARWPRPSWTRCRSTRPTRAS
jgi:hypothetical protein